jgi:hypothetical protein
MAQGWLPLLVMVAALSWTPHPVEAGQEQGAPHQRDAAQAEQRLAQTPPPPMKGVGPPDHLKGRDPQQKAEAIEAETRQNRAPPGDGNPITRILKGIDWGTAPDWAIVAFTAMLTILGWLQFRLSDRNARETKAALAIAKTSADAAQVSAAATAELAHHGRVTARAYAHLSLDIPKPETYGQRSIELGFTITNNGATPARVSRIDYAVITPDAEGQVTMPPDGDYSQARSVDTDVIFAPGKAGTPLHIDAPLSGVAYARLIYADVFGDPHESRMCLQYNAVTRTLAVHGEKGWNEET